MTRDLERNLKIMSQFRQTLMVRQMVKMIQTTHQDTLKTLMSNQTLMILKMLTKLTHSFQKLSQ